MQTIRVAVAGAAGRMGRESVRAIASQQDMQVVAAIDPAAAGQDAGLVAGLPALNLTVLADAEAALAESQSQVLVDFTTAAAAMPILRAGLKRRIAAVVGTTGFSESDVEEIAELCRRHSVGAIVAPNFAIGAVLMMKFACEAAEYLPCAEIIELHHDQKRDAPSGTALRTAEMMQAAAGTALRARPGDQQSRGQAAGPIRIHSVRLQGLVAHQEVIFGGPGQTLTIRHDSTGRESFMPGMLLAVRKVGSLQRLVVGLENIL
jgi:4-hydroxy-tetrahydrodipicolinate reductase